MNPKMKPASKKNLFDDEGESSTDSSSSSSASSSSVADTGKNVDKMKTKKESSSSSSSSSDEEEEETKLTVNKKFAKEYQNRKEAEELRQIAQQRRDAGLGSDDDGDDDDDSSDEDEDEEGKLLTDSLNLQFLKTIQALKKKDSAIYDPNSRFFDENDRDEDSDEEEGAEKKRKPRKFKDVLRDQILEDMEAEDQDNGKTDTAKADVSNSKLAYDEEQEKLRKAFLKDSNDDEEEDDWMIMKQKSATSKDDPKTTKIQEEFKALEQLSGKKKDSDTFADPRGEVDDGEQYLIDFMKNKKWIDKDATEQDNLDEESSVEDLDRVDDFEAKYNFRFEQAEAATAASGASLSIQTYARGQTMNTVRRQDAVRKDKRLARKERKEAERKAKEEQLKRLKNAKRQEVQQKMSQVKAVLGSMDEAEVDEAAIMKMLEGDYDPEQFEKAMQTAYGDEYYEKEDAEWKSDLDVRKSLKADEEGEGVVGQDDPDGGLYDNYDGDNDDEENASNWEDEEDNEEYVGGDDPEESQLEKKIKTKLQDELYKLDYEDIVAGMPTRFKYRQVEPNDYGVTTQEILLARDNTLKQFVSLKKMAPYNETGEYHVGSKKRRRFREMLKHDLEEEMGAEEANDNEMKEHNDPPEEDGQGKKKRRRLKKGKKKSKEDAADDVNEEECALEPSAKADRIVLETEKSKKRRKKNKDGKVADTSDDSILPVNENSDPTNKQKMSEEAVHDKGGSNPENTKRRKKKSKKKAVASLPKSRLASYGL